MLKVKAKPTFKAKVEIPAAGGEVVTVEFEFKHRKASELDKLIFGDEADGKSNEEIILSIVSGWDQGCDLNAESLHELFEDFEAAPRTIIKKYAFELTQGRLGN